MDARPPLSGLDLAGPLGLLGLLLGASAVALALPVDAGSPDPARVGAAGPQARPQAGERAKGQKQPKAGERAKGQKQPQAPEPDMELADRYFAICDYDGNGWISFREAEQSLELDRSRWLVFDRNLDGMITPDEFRRVFADTVKKIGAFKPPKPDPTRAAATPELPGPDAIGAQPVPPSRRARTVEELFGRVEERQDPVHATPRPARIVGPVPHFRRLDFDADGLISVDDLTTLGRPVQVAVRLNALVAILDTDGDGGVSRAELYDSMRHRPVGSR